MAEDDQYILLGDDNQTQGTNSQLDNMEDSGFLLPPYPDDLPDPLTGQESENQSPTNGSPYVDNDEHSNKPPNDSLLSPDSQDVGINPGLEPLIVDDDATWNQNSNDKEIDFAPNPIQSKEQETILNTVEDSPKDTFVSHLSIDLSGDINNKNGEEKENSNSLYRLSAVDTNNDARANSESNTEIVDEKESIKISSKVAPTHVITQGIDQEFITIHKDCTKNNTHSEERQSLPQQETSDMITIASSQENNELWPPVPDIANVVAEMEMESQLEEIDKFCEEYGKGKNEFKEHSSKFPKILPKCLPNDESADSTVFPKENASVELFVPNTTVEQGDKVEPSSGSREFNIALDISGSTEPEQNIPEMSQRRRERYAHSKGPFWAKPVDSSSSLQKVDTPMDISPYDNVYVQDDQEMETQGVLKDNDTSPKDVPKPDEGEPATKSDIIVIKIAGDSGSKTKQKIVEIVNELKRLSSLDEAIVEGSDLRSDDDKLLNEITELPSPLRTGSSDPRTNLELIQREGNTIQNQGRNKNVNFRSLVNSSRAQRILGHSGSLGSAGTKKVGSAVPFRRNVSFQDEHLKPERHNSGNSDPNVDFPLFDTNRQLASQTQRQNSSQSGSITQTSPRTDVHSGGQTPSSDSENETPRAKINHKGAQYKRFDYRKQRPRSAEIPSGHKILRFLNSNNGSGGTETNSNTSLKDLESPEAVQELKLSNGSVNNQPRSLAVLGQTNDAFENESQLSGDELVMELLRVSGKNAGALSPSTVDSAEESETNIDETTPLTGNQHRRQKSLVFFDDKVKDRPVDLDSIDEDVDETCPLRGSVTPPDDLPDTEGQDDDDFLNDEYDNLSLEFVVPGSKKHIRLHRQTFISFVLKYSIFFFSFIFWSASVSGIGFGTWMLTRKSVGFNDASDVMLDPHALLCMVGGIIFLVACLGCLGALRENVPLLLMFHISLTAVVALEGFLTALIFLFYTIPEFRRAAKVGPEEILKKAVIRYFDDDNMKDWIDNLQKEFRCCGVSLSDDGYLDWSENMYFNCTPSNPSVYRCSVPLSCCIFEPGDYINYMCGIGIIGREVSYVNRYINTKGCMKSFGEWLADNTSLIAYVGLAFFIPQILGVVAARFFIKNLRKQQKKALEAKMAELEHEQSVDDEETPTATDVEITFK